MTDRFPFEHIVVAGQDALPTWERLKGDGGGWPIVLGSAEDFDRIVEGFEDMREHMASLDIPGAANPNFRFPEDYRKRRADDLKKFQTEHPEWFGEEEEYSAPRGDWPEIPPEDTGLHVDRDILSQLHHDEVHIIRLPTADWTEAPIHLSWGGWNDCPFPHEHVAAFRSWRDRYGVELAGMAGDVLTLRASRPPGTREEALLLAQEHYEYCSDIVEQGVGTLDELAAGLLTNRWWFFWWD